MRRRVRRLPANAPAGNKQGGGQMYIGLGTVTLILVIILLILLF